MKRAVAIVLVSLAASTADAFPPYRSTDADTADPWNLELRLGARLVRAAGTNGYGAPAMRLNLGLQHHLELTTELEVEPEEPRLADLAAGGKWVPIRLGRLAFGIEALVLLPTSSAGGAGIEVSLLATYREERYHVHANVAGFHDARPDPAETGWKASLLGEAVLGRARPGVELFAKQVDDADVQVLAGLGAIVRVADALDVRAALHVGVTDAAPDVVASLWVAGKLPLR